MKPLQDRGYRLSLIHQEPHADKTGHPSFNLHRGTEGKVLKTAIKEETPEKWLWEVIRKTYEGRG